jgi:hypothetical protein
MSIRGVANSDGFFANNNGADSRVGIPDALQALRRTAVDGEQIASVADLLNLVP